MHRIGAGVGIAHVMIPPRLGGQHHAYGPRTFREDVVLDDHVLAAVDGDGTHT